MKKIPDKKLARTLLQTHEQGGYKVLPFLRTNAKGYLFVGIYFPLIMAFFAFTGCWDSFGYMAFFLVGILLRDVSWFIGMRRSWPFVSKIINWDEVKKISNDEPSA